MMSGWTPAQHGHWTRYLSHDDICYGESFATLTSDVNKSTQEFISRLSRPFYISGQMIWTIKCGLHFMAFMPKVLAWR